MFYYYLQKKTLWSNFAGAAKKYIPNLYGNSTVRGFRYFGPSKMPLTGLVIHSLSIIASFKFQVLIRSILMIALFSFFHFQMNKDIIFIIFNFLVVIFCLIIFAVSKRENAEDFKDCLSRIKNVVNIHTIRL